MKKLPLLIVALVLIAGIIPLSGQGYTEVANPWEYYTVRDEAAWPQFAAVDGDGNLWIGDYSGPVDIFDVNGTRIAKWDSVTYNDGTNDVTEGLRACKGMNVAANGNILFLIQNGLVELDASALTTTSELVTATAVNFWSSGGGSTTGPAVDDLGYIYMTLTIYL